MTDAPKAPSTFDLPRDRQDDYAKVAAERLDSWRDEFRPASAFENWLFALLVECSVRIDRCHHQEAITRGNLARRARLLWDVDRAAEAEEIGARLSRDPSRTVARLRTFRQGCEWLLVRWNGLLRALGPDGECSWNDAQRKLARDLAGTPAAFRDQEPWETAGHSSALEWVKLAIERLATEIQGALESLDQAERFQAERGFEVRSDAELTRIRKERDAWTRRFLWARTQLQRARKAAPDPVDTRKRCESENQYDDSIISKSIIKTPISAGDRPRTPVEGGVVRPSRGASRRVRWEKDSPATTEGSGPSRSERRGRIARGEVPG